MGRNQRNTLENIFQYILRLSDMIFILALMKLNKLEAGFTALFQPKISRENIAQVDDPGYWSHAKW
jgi:hypothetical protein